MTMTSNYDKYIRPETWPVAPHLIGWAFIGRASKGGRTTIYGAETRNGAWAVGRHALVDVPSGIVHEVADAIDAYCNACRKLTG